MEAKPTAIISQTLPIPAKAIWPLFANFGNWIDWFPIYRKQDTVSQIKEGAGLVRSEVLLNGTTTLEELKVIDNEKCHLEYQFLSSKPETPIIKSSHAAIDIQDLPEGKSLFTWKSWTTLVDGSDATKLESVVAAQTQLYAKGLKSALFHLTLKKHYQEAFSLINEKMMDLYKGLLLGLHETWEYDDYPLTERAKAKGGKLPKMVVGLPGSEALAPQKVAGMLGRLLEVGYMAIDKMILHANDKIPDGVDPYQAACLEIADKYADEPHQKLTQYLSSHWKEDIEFSQQYLQGANPIHLQIVSDFEKQVPKNMRNLKAQGKTVLELFNEKRLFFADYDLLDGLDRQPGIYFYAPTVLLFNEHLESGEKRLNVVGIRLERTDNAVVYTPDMPQRNRWKLAKMFVTNADNQVHQFALHMCLAHFCMEVVVIANHNTLAPKQKGDPEHPIYKLLLPHLKETIGINFLARQSLIPRKGALTNKTFSIGTVQGIEIAAVLYKDWEFYKSSFPEQLKSRGFDREGTDGLTNYLYREDGYKLWDLLGNYVNEYVDEVYSSDEKVAADVPLQNFAAEMVHPDKGNTKGFPDKFTTRKQLAEALRIIIWNGSAFHSILNFPQWPYVGNIPNRPNAMYAPMPEDKGEDVTPQQIKEALAPELGTVFQLSFTWALSLPSTTSLKDLGEKAKNETEAGKRFHESLIKYTEHLHARNKKLVDEGKAPYIYLLPENVACSVDI